MRHRVHRETMGRGTIRHFLKNAAMSAGILFCMIHSSFQSHLNCHVLPHLLKTWQAERPQALSAEAYGAEEHLAFTCYSEKQLNILPLAKSQKRSGCNNRLALLPPPPTLLEFLQSLSLVSFLMPMSFMCTNLAVRVSYPGKCSALTCSESLLLLFCTEWLLTVQFPQIY